MGWVYFSMMDNGDIYVFFFDSVSREWMFFELVVEGCIVCCVVMLVIVE